MTHETSSQVKTVHLVFKTHLDIGFTDYAHKVLQAYFTDFIPAAIRTARQLRDSDTRFRWTVGSWLVYKYMQQATDSQRHELDDAIQHGDIVWHGLPFTTHTELMDPSLFRFGLTYAQELDQRYNKRTISAKMTDVPGHTHGIVPLLSEAGIEFLHIGVNPASMPPDVPPLFVWRDEPSGSQITVMYHTVYGDISTIPGTDQAIAIEFTGDNIGPPSPESIRTTYQELQKTFPDAHIMASTLDRFAEAIRPVTHTLPVITEEIGDTWIHGAGSDPTKMRHYRALLRLRKYWLEADKIDHQRIKAFSDSLILVPEHTWGMDEKTHFPDQIHYMPDQLATIRHTTRAQLFEASWNEQRDYLTTAVEALQESGLHDQAMSELVKVKPRMPSLERYEPVSGGIDTGKFEVGWDESTGELTHLLVKKDQRQLAAGDHRLGTFTYEVFSAADYERFWQQYIRESEEVLRWARDDFVKAGLPDYGYQRWQPVLQGAYQSETGEFFKLLLSLKMPPESTIYGTPRALFIEYLFPQTGDKVDARVQWFEKAASRLPEALWFSFRPIVKEPDQWRLHKLGQFISPLNVISHGARSLHAVEDGVFNLSGHDPLRIISWDMPLVAFGSRSLLNFTNELPDPEQGIHFNLYNNVWGTNFRMWFDEDALFRFTMAFDRYPDG